MSHFQELSFDCVLPSAIFSNKNLQPNCIKLYAFVRNLTKQSGYCYATNTYLSEIMGCKERNVQNLLVALQQEGYLEIETEKNGIHWQRRIYLSDKFKESLRRAKICTPPCKNLHPPMQKFAPIIEEYTNSSSLRSEEEEKRNKRSAAPPPSADAENLAHFFFEKIKERNPECKEPNLKKWSQEMDLLLRIDKRTMDNVKKLIEWAHVDSFWKSNCLSPRSLRKNYDQMNMQQHGEKEKDLVRSNRNYAVAMKEKYPDKLKTLTFDDKYVINRSIAKEVAFNMHQEAFRQAFFSLFGGVYVPKG